MTNELNTTHTNRSLGWRRHPYIRLRSSRLVREDGWKDLGFKAMFVASGARSIRGAYSWLEGYGYVPSAITKITRRL